MTPDLLEPIDQEKFERFVRDALANLYDLTALQTHPLAQFFVPDASKTHSRGEGMRDSILKSIERLRPSEEAPRPGSPEWRPYLILFWRYVDGIGLEEIQKRLALSGRQFRREHGRAVQAVATLLWDQAFPPQAGWARPPQPGGLEPGLPDDPERFADSSDAAQAQPTTFAVKKTSLDIDELIQGVVNTLQRRAQEEGLLLKMLACDHPAKVMADRVVLRQILISLLNYAMEITQEESVAIYCEALESHMVVHIHLAGFRQTPVVEVENPLLAKALSWAERIDANIQVTHTTQPLRELDFSIQLPYANQPVLLAIDDHEIALRMYKRYTSQMNIRLVGLQDGSQVVDMARDLQPDLIFLDVMIPNMDGWEVLQALRANPATSHIPVVICTVWEEPELAFSLGAAGFLKKPISQQEFLSMLARFGLR